MKGILTFIVILISCAPVLAEDVIIESSEGELNWTSGVITAFGAVNIPESLKNNPGAKRALTSKARLLAYRNLAEMVADVRITSSTTVENLMLTHDIVTTKVEALIQGARISDIIDDGETIIVEAELDTNTGFVQSVVPEHFTAGIRLEHPHASQSRFWPQIWEKIHAIPVFGKVYAAEREDFPNINTPEELIYARKLHSWLLINDNSLASQLGMAIEKYEDNSLYTGVLIDASSVKDFDLAVIPTIRNQKGEKIYPGTIFDFLDGRNPRPVSYDFSVDEATLNKRVANHPVVIKALSTYKALKSDLVITNESAELILQNQHVTSAMKTAAVMIVINKG